MHSKTHPIANSVLFTSFLSALKHAQLLPTTVLIFHTYISVVEL